MNIIIRSETEYQLTEYNKNSIYDINNIKFYSKSAIPKEFILSYENTSNPLLAQYYILPIEATEIKENDYILYTISANGFVIGKPYTVNIKFDDEVLLQLNEIIQIDNDILQDEHEALKVTGRNITIPSGSVALLAEDCRSQKITLLIKESYDGISFLDKSKTIYMDYIPPDLTPTEDVPFYSDSNIERYVDNSLFINNEQWIKLIWTVPYAATKQAGTLKFALSVIGALPNGDCYVWQTLPVSLTVQQNIGKRPALPIVPDGNPESFAIEKRIADLEEFTANIDNVTQINQENGTITHIERENGKDTEEVTISVADLWAAGLQSEEVVING